MMNLKSQDVEFSQYTIVAPDPERSCENCNCYKPIDGTMGICYEYEALPKAGCKFFSPKK